MAMSSATSAELPKCKLPDLSHLSSSDYQNVYEPSDDTFLLVDALAAEATHAAETAEARQPLLCVEVGSGSGTVVTHLGLLSRQASEGSFRRSVALMATDLNPLAAAATAVTAAANGVTVHVIQMDLLSAMRPGCIDMIVFNPPYVPTSEEECLEGAAARDISAAWAGGPRGRLILDRLLPELPSLLSPTGKAQQAAAESTSSSQWTGQGTGSCGGEMRSTLCCAGMLDWKLAPMSRLLACRCVLLARCQGERARRAEQHHAEAWLQLQNHRRAACAE